MNRFKDFTPKEQRLLYAAISIGCKALMESRDQCVLGSESYKIYQKDADEMDKLRAEVLGHV